MKYLLPILFIVATQVVAQKHLRNYDFSKVDPSQTSIREIDSLFENWYFKIGLDSLSRLREYVHERTFTPKYAAIGLGYMNSTATLEYLNSGLRALGIPEMSQNFSCIPFEIDVRNKKVLYSYTMCIGIANSVSNGVYTVEARGIQLEFLVGYDLLNLKRVHFYPFVGIALQGFDLRSFRNAATQDITDINTFVLNSSGTNLSQRLGAINYGAELDIRVTNAYSTTGLMLGFRYGSTLSFAEGSFSDNGNSSSFSSSDKIYGPFYSVVVKALFRTR